MPPIISVNNAPTGIVTITGIPAPDLTLYATNNIADLDGLGAISYQWFADNVAIVGATGSSFTVTVTQVGKALSVQASYIDLLGTLEIITSDSTGTVVLVGSIPTPSGGLTVTGTDLADTLTGSSGTDLILGLAGNDTIDGQAGSDTVYGGEGDDRIEGNFGNDTLYGENGNDTLTDDQGSNLLDGGAGNDNLTSRSLSGNHTLLGGTGYDTLTATGLLVNLDGGEQDDNLYATGATYQSGGTSYVQNGTATLIGGTGNDNLNATYYTTSSLDGGEGNDYLLANGTANNYYSSLSAQPMTSTLVGGTGDDTLNAQWLSNADLSGGDGADNLTVNYSRTATLSGGTGTDTLSVNFDSYWSQYTDGDSRLAKTYVLDGGADNDNLSVNGGSYSYYGQTTVTLLGGSGDDTLNVSDYIAGDTGTSGQNYGIASASLEGGVGNDKLTAGGVLHLSMTGGAGADSFILTAQQYRTLLEGTRNFTNSDYSTTAVTADPTIITDFTVGVGGDVLDYSDLLRNGALTYDGTNPFGNGFLNLVQSGTDTLVKFDADGEVGNASSPLTIARLFNVNAANLNGASFNPNFDFGAYQYTFNVTPTLTSLSSPVNTGAEDTAISVSFATLVSLANESDVDGTVNAFSVKSVSSGTLTIGSSAASAQPWNTSTNYIVDAYHHAYWTPDADANGSLNAFKIVARDNDYLESATPLQVIIDVTPVNDAPVSIDDVLSTYQNTSITFATSDLLANDTDVEGNALNVVSVSSGAHGSAVLNNNGTVTFTPALGYSGDADFSYVLSDGQLNSNSAKVTVQVNPINTAPEGVNATLSTIENTTLNISSSAFAFTDLQNHNIQAVKISILPLAGHLVLDGNNVTVGQFITTTDIAANKLVFVPAANGNGLAYAEFGFQVQDDGGTAFGGVDLDPSVNTITINVSSVNNPPTLTQFDQVIVKGLEHTPTPITFNNLLAHSDATDVDGTVVAFDIKSVESGTLLIGSDLASATAWNAITNFIVDATHLAFWISNLSANGKINAFTAVAKDNADSVSAVPLLAKVSVLHKINETSGSDRLLGSNVDDSFDIVSGQDTLTGGPGSDDFIISSTNVVIKDLGLGGDLLHVANGASVNAILGDHFIADSASNNDGLATLTDNGSFNVDLHLASGVNGFTVNAAKSISGVSLVGSSHVDNITGGKGADIIDGGADNDSIVAGDGNDSLLGGLGDDNLSAGKGDDTLSGGAGNNTLTGGAGNDTFIVSATAVDSITDLGLGDVIQNAVGGQVTANTTKLWTASAGVVNNGTIVINALDSVDLSAMTGSGDVTVNFIGTKAIKLTSGNQVTRLNGGAGKDTLTAGLGNTTLSGGAGDDTYLINSANVTIIEGTDVGLKGDLVKSSVDFTLSANVEQLTLFGTTAHLATGNALNNTITANNAGDTLDGGLGNDKLIGGAGNDTFIIDSTADTVTDRLGGIDTIQSSVSYVLPANIENLILTGSSAINGTGNRLANSLTGNDGNNILTAGTGDTTISGGLGNDTIYGSKGNNNLNGGDGDDIITAHVRGQAANIIDGGLGNDTITGGAGVNTLTGGEGADTFIFVKGNGLTTITDFVSGVDHIQINPLVFRGLSANTDVNSNTFVANTTGLPINTLQHFIYNTTTGTLYFDADGTGLRSSAVAIEVLGTATHPTLTVNDIWVG